MLEGTVLHKGRSGARGDGDVVGISWKAPTRSHPSPSLVVTCAHHVVVYKPGEERRTHQWSFKPSAATVLSHAAVFLPAGSRYVGVQQGSTLVSWRESEQDVKRPLSCQAAGPVQAVHACPQLGDYFVTVLASGGVAFYQGGLQRVAHCDAAGGGDDGAGSAVGARAKAVWSGVRGNKVVVLENIGAATDRVTTFALAIGGGASGQPSSYSSSRCTKAAAGGGGRGSTGAPVSASVTLVSSHLLTKPSQFTPPGSGEEQAEVGERETSASACSAAFLGRDNAIAGGGGGGGGRSVIAVAWRMSRGPVWTKVVVGAGGAEEEFARPAGAPEPASSHRASDGNGNGVVSMSPSNGHGTPKSGKSKAKKSAARAAHVISGGKGSVAAGWARVPAIAAADGGRLLVHGGGGGGAGPRLAVWDVTYGVLLEDSAAPESSIDGAGPSPSSGERKARAVGMKVSGDGAHLALAVAGRVIVCSVPVKAVGTLASLLRRKRPPSGVEGGGGGGSLAAVAGGGLAFPSVDLAGSASASKLLEQTGTLEAGDWEAAVVTPFRAAEAEVVRSLRDAVRRKDGGAFERALREHLQQRAAAAAGAGGTSSGEVSGDGVVVSGGGYGGRKKRRRNGPTAAVGGYSAGIIAAAVELCLANPHAKLWGALSMLVRSGGVSARHHRGLVTAIVEHASGELLEEVMLHVPDLPEADAVRILRHFLSQAAALAEGPSDPDPAGTAAAMLVPEVPNKASGGPPPAKRARGGNSNSNGGGVVNAAGSPVVQSDGGGGVVVSVLSPSTGKKNGAAAAGEKDGVSGDKSMKVKLKAKNKNHEKTNSKDDGDDDDDDIDGGKAKAGHANSNGNGNTVTTNAGLSNGHAAAHDDGGTSSDGGVSDGGGGVETRLSGPMGGGGAAASNKHRNNGSPREAAIATAVAAVQAERGVRVALTLPHNEAFLRSALAGLSHGEVVIVLKVLTRLLAEGKTLEASAAGAKPRGRNTSIATKGLPAARTDSVLGWACALLDSHFTRLAIGGSADANLVRALKALKKATREEAECCELMGEVRSLVEEVGRRHAAAAVEEARRRPSRELFTLRVLSF